MPRRNGGVSRRGLGVSRTLTAGGRRQDITTQSRIDDWVIGNVNERRAARIKTSEWPP
jgi:hypothetical protein